jgi:hypothetical protein
VTKVTSDKMTSYSPGKHVSESDNLKELSDLHKRKVPESQVISVVTKYLKPKFNFQFYWLEIKQYISVLLDTGAMLNIVISDKVKSHGLSPTERT